MKIGISVPRAGSKIGLWFNEMCQCFCLYLGWDSAEHNLEKRDLGEECTASEKGIRKVKEAPFGKASEDGIAPMGTVRAVEADLGILWSSSSRSVLSCQP